MMEEIFAACITYEPGLIDYIDFSKFTEPVWLLGKKYNTLDGKDFEQLEEDIKSRIWFTYRKQFLPIGDTCFTSDSGWGCMHRCGQMLMAQALLIKHLGREWTWHPNVIDKKYLRLLYRFDDREDCQFSIHRIAAQGSILDKTIGQWFGPNTVVQVLKKIIDDEKETDIAIHVAMDNMVVKSELRKMFYSCNEPQKTHDLQTSYQVSKNCNAVNSDELLSRNSPGHSNSLCGNFKPVLLTIPLRLGLSEITPVYFEKLKASFTLKQSLGIVGGRTNHASYFIGYVDNELIYLDPHTTQLHNDGLMDDKSYHCEHPSRMDFKQLDPSIALCFYLGDEEDFEDWCREAQKLLLEPEKDAIFEILEEKPPMLPYVDMDDPDDSLTYTLCESDRIYTSDEEFELLM